MQALNSTWVRLQLKEKLNWVGSDGTKTQAHSKSNLGQNLEIHTCRSLTNPFENLTLIGAGWRGTSLNPTHCRTQACHKKVYQNRGFGVILIPQRSTWQDS